MRRCLYVDHATYRVRDHQQPIAAASCTVRPATGPTRNRPRHLRDQGVLTRFLLGFRSRPSSFDQDGTDRQRDRGESASSTGRNPSLRLVNDALCRALRVPGQRPLTEFYLTKLDVLDTWERIPVCVAYAGRRCPARRYADDPDRVTTTRPRYSTSDGGGHRHLRVPSRRPA